MPNIKSAKKRVLTSAKKRVNNNVTEQKTKSSIKKTIKDVEAGNKEAATANYNAAIKNITFTPNASLSEIKPNVFANSQLESITLPKEA